MDTQEIAVVLREFIRREFGVPDNDPDFDDHVDLFNYGYIDSFGAVTLTSFIEERFKIQFGESDWVDHPMSSIKQISEFVEKRQRAEL